MKSIGATRKRAIGHHRVFKRVMIEWQHRERDAMAVLRRMSVLQAEIVPGLVHDTRCKFEIAQARIGVFAVGEPTVSLGEQRRIGSRAAKSSLGRVGLSRA